jgi:lysine 2,3-aminomutase
MSAPRISANLLPGPPEEWVANGYLPLASYPMRTTDYYASLIQSASPHDPIARQCVPRVEEENLQGEKDPLGELGKEPVPGLLHVYPDRALLLATDTCAVNCRHCNRRWKRGTHCWASDDDVVAGWLEYLGRCEEIREVLITGGDPLTLSHPVLENLLTKISQLKTDPLIRIGSRIPAVWPERVNSRLLKSLRGAAPLYLHTQFNCPAECTPQAGEALRRLADAGVNLGNQMVLLKGVNAKVESIATVNRWLVRQRCRPYYLFLPEKVQGTAHFQVDASRAVAIGQALRKQLSGIAMPTLVADTPNGGGKVPLHSEALIRRDGRVGIRDLMGRLVWLG